MRGINVIWFFLFLPACIAAQGLTRMIIPMDKQWKSVARDKDIHAFEGFERPDYNDSKWKTVNVPHTWDQYEGYRRQLAGNRHGYAWYRKSFRTDLRRAGKRFFLNFEGVGSYATVYLNGKLVGKHAGGRTTFSLDITNVVLLNNKTNIISVRADHPEGIRDLPWVDGGSSAERGFSEGSQPMGIFRPVQLVVTSDLRIEPFGVHIWNDTAVSAASASVKINTELKNYSGQEKEFSIFSQLLGKNGTVAGSVKRNVKLKAGENTIVSQEINVQKPSLWSPATPYLYLLKSKILVANKTVDELISPYGIRTISWPVGAAKNNKQFLINGEPFFINGIAEYEHLIGSSHAFTAEQVRSRVMQIKAAGFNAFRDAHQPHNLRYLNYWDELGILCWTQMAAHVWYDTPAFRNNFKTLLREWVKERRNSPSVVLWGLENESTLPEDFARECTTIIREMDPTASGQRKVTTCNGGKGTDWDVPQNWTGTYGGDPNDYAKDMERQVLIGEYGAWRTLDLHTEGPFVQNGPYSEERISQLMETKIGLAEAAKDKTAGHFFWLFNSHDNPGRVQGGEGLRELDRVGPVNYKGLLTPWEEPLDVYYLYRANYAPKITSPMVYIVSHTWPDRWLEPGTKDSISVYSNCDEVELYNDLDAVSLGRKKNKGRGTHFQWDKVNVAYNILYAIGYVHGKAVAKDTIILSHLPAAPHLKQLYQNSGTLSAQNGYNYLYRVNAGGPDYRDTNGNLWMADRQQTDQDHWGSTSWAADFPGTPSFFASQRRTFDPIRGTGDWKLFQTFRYGRERLKYEFPVPDGEYLIELYFIEPWLGTGGGMDCTGWRLFDVAINNKVVLKDLDIWQAAGHDAALKKTFKAKVTGGHLVISFPNIKSGQALISAIAIASNQPAIKPAAPSPSAAIMVKINSQAASMDTWMDTGGDFTTLPPELFGADWIVVKPREELSFRLDKAADIYIAADSLNNNILEGFEDSKTVLRDEKGKQLKVYKKRFSKNSEVALMADPEKSYTLIVVPVSSLAPAYDLKSAVNYTALNSFPTAKGVVKAPLAGKERLKFVQNEGSLINFQISVGVADTYSLTLKYHNPSDEDMKVSLEVLAMDGTVMKKPALITLSPTKEGKWNYAATDTGTMINAGSYRVLIRSINSSGASIDGLEVQ